MDWIMSFGKFESLWHQPPYIIVQAVFLIGSFCTIKHALSCGNGWLLFWMVALINGVMVEAIAFFTPFINNFWHSPGFIMFLGNRLPLHVVLFYPCVYYVAAVGAKSMKICRRYECLAVGLLAILINIPLDLIGSKFLFWTWHDTDPSLLERSYNVPWISHIFHFILPSLITFFFFNRMDDVRQNSNRRSLTNGKKVTVSLLLATPCSFILFSLLYHGLHDLLRIHSQIVFLGLFSVVLSILWTVDRNDEKQIVSNPTGILFVSFYLILHYSILTATAIFWDPSTQISIGYHQQIGDCHTIEPLYTLIGTVLQRRKYLCLEDYNAAYFDFHCVNNFSIGSDRILEHYAVCGTDYANKSEFIYIMITIDIVAALVFGNIFRNTLNNIKNKEA